MDSATDFGIAESDQTERGDTGSQLRESLAGESHAELLRRQLCERARAKNYRPLAHLLFPSLIGLAVAAFGLLALRELRPLELLIVPLTYVLGLGLEWRAHKDLLHRRWPGPFAELYERHERHHHVVYTDENMAMRAPEEMALVLMPWFAIVLVTLVLLPMVALTYYLTTRNCALLVLMTGVAFFVSYEWLHLSYHLPKTHPVAKLWLVRRLGAYHRYHHNPRHMKRWNFNVTIPLFDVVHRTLRLDDSDDKAR